MEFLTENQAKWVFLEEFVLVRLNNPNNKRSGREAVEEGIRVWNLIKRECIDTKAE